MAKTINEGLVVGGETQMVSPRMDGWMDGTSNPKYGS
jgi:hypothetical protein